jgi:hypothetical protein
MSDQDTSAYQPPPPPDFPSDSEQPTGPKVPVTDTLTGIFFEPGKTFESLRNRPRFLIAMVISILAIMTFILLYTQRIGYDRIVREAIESSPRTSSMTPEQRQQQIEMQTKPIFKVIGYVAPAVLIVVFFFAGGGLYLLGTMLMGGKIRFKQALAVWTYAGFPPILLTSLLNIILLFIKSEDSYDIVQAQRTGLVQANLSFLVDGKASPVLYTLLGSLDVFQFYGLFLAALGLRLVGKLSSGSAWAIVITLFLIGVVLKAGGSILFGAM